MNPALKEVDFLQAAIPLKADMSTKKHAIGPDFYRLLESNKAAFEDVFEIERTTVSSGGGSSEVRLTRILRAILHTPEFTDDDEEYVRGILELIEDGALPKATIRKVLKDIGDALEPLQILAKLRSGISEEFFRPTFGPVDISGPREVILSGYFAGGDSA